MPRPISLIHPYYNDAKRLALQLEVWKKWSPKVCESVDITLVDDGSPQALTFTEDAKNMFKEKKIRVGAYRILKDIKWNTPGALNLGVFVAPQPWVLFMDSDCFFDSEQWEKILNLDQPDNRIGKFARKRQGTEGPAVIQNNRYLPCTMLMHKQIFMCLGGFDEDFTGAYSGGYAFFDNDFDRRAIKAGFWHEDKCGSSCNHCIYNNIFAGEWMPSVCGSPVQRDHEKDHNINKKLFYAKRDGKVAQNRQVLRFEWQQTYRNWI
jgi:glycosyltransferase involved in cell wall biosynthesis